MPAPQYPYTFNVPLAAMKISSSQPPIYNNFQAINEWLNINHIGFSNPLVGTNPGEHNLTSFVIQPSDPSTSSTDMALYSKATVDPAGVQLFARYPSNGPVVQISANGQSGVGTNTGYSYFTSTIFCQWGTATGFVVGANVINFGRAFTNPAQCVTFTSIGNGWTPTYPGPYVSNFTTTGFTYNVPNVTSPTISWFAVGV